MKKLGSNDPELACCNHPIKSLLAHLSPIFLSISKDKELPKTLIADCEKLRQNEKISV